MSPVSCKGGPPYPILGRRGIIKKIAMEWETVLSDSVKNGQIRELHLSRIPVLKTCDNWKNVKPIGWIDHKMRHSNYKGGLVKFNGKIYFVREATLDAIRQYINIRFSQLIVVIPE